MARTGKPDRTEVTQVTDLAIAVRKGVRLELLLGIAWRPACVAELAKRHELDNTVVCKHLRVLRKLGLLKYTQALHRRIYSLSDGAQVHWAEHEVQISLWSDDAGNLAARVPLSTLQSVAPWLFGRDGVMSEVKPLPSHAKPPSVP